MKSKFKGLGVALVTPFTASLDIDINGLNNIVEHVIEGGAQFLVALGTTSEAPTLSREEQAIVLKTIITQNKGRLPIVLGLGGNNTGNLLELLAGLDHSGVDALLSVVPYYNKPSQEGLIAHFSALAQNSPLPIILYNVPGRTVTNMLPSSTLSLVSMHKNIIGIKEASGNIAQGMQIVQKAPEKFIILSGDDDLVLPQIAAGFHGVISVIGNAYPNHFSKMIQLMQEGKLTQSQNIHYKLLPLIDMLFEEGNPAGIKATLHHLGLCEPYVRLPLVAASSGLRNRIKEHMSQISD